MADYRTDCVNKPHRDSPHEHIIHVGGPSPTGGSRWNDTAANVVRFIEDNVHRFYTDERGARAWVGVNTSRSGRRFLQTHADGVWRDNLLALPECR
jgi:hypothetical protein